MNIIVHIKTEVINVRMVTTVGPSAIFLMTIPSTISTRSYKVRTLFMPVAYSEGRGQTDRNGWQ